MLEREISAMELIKEKNVIVFDGECVLCNGFFQFVLKHDKNNEFCFMTAQSPGGEALYQHYGLKQDDYDTNLVFIGGELYQRMHGVFEILKRFGMPWRMLTVFGVLPNFLLDWGYYKIARNRYRLFGRRETCFVPDAETEARFIGVVRTGD